MSGREIFASLEEMRSLALREWKQKEARAQMDAEESAERRRTFAREELMNRVRSVLRIALTSDAIRVEEFADRYPPEFIATTDVLAEGWSAEAVTEYGVHVGIRLSRPCPECDDRIRSDLIKNLADFGQFLASDFQSLHVHFFEEDSTHPNAPKPAAPQDDDPFPGSPAYVSPEDRIISALREMVAREVEGILNHQDPR